MSEFLRQPIEAIEAVQTDKLRSMLDLCARGHPFYRRRWAEAGIDIASIQSLDDLVRLPLTTKHDLMADPESFRLKVPELPLHERILWDVIYTTGSTAEPTPIYNTTHDYHAYLFQSRRVAEISDLRESDVIANLFPLTAAPMGAFIRAAANAYAVGATIFGALPGSPHGAFDVHRSLDYAAKSVATHRATVLWGIPSFIRRLLMHAMEQGFDFSSVRMCAITGEATSPAMREELRRCMRDLGAAGTAVFNRYGSTELGAFAQCQEEGEWHNPAPEIQYHEIVDPETGQRLADGERGALAVTYLDRRGTVLIRFVVGDVASIVRTPCSVCGRMGDRVVGPIVRAKDLIKIKGMLINPAVLLDVLQATPCVEEFQVVIRRQKADDPFSMDEMVVRAATQSEDRAGLEATIIARTREAVRISPRVEFVAASQIYDGKQTKAVRFIDQRGPI